MNVLNPQAAPAWLRPLVDNAPDLPQAYRRRVPATVLAASGPRLGMAA